MEATKEEKCQTLMISVSGIKAPCHLPHRHEALGDKYLGYKIKQTHYNSKAIVSLIYINLEVAIFCKNLYKLLNETLRLTDNYSY